MPDSLRPTQEELLALVVRLSEFIQEQKEHKVPISIFGSKYSPAEALVTYLKEHKQLNYADIARLLNRDQRGIWNTYRRAQQKEAELPITNGHTIPISIFKDRQLSILEHVVHHLRSQDIRVNAISELLNKHPSTIAAVHHRVRRKQA